MTNNSIKLNTINEAIDDVKSGKVIIVVDDEGRENEGDFICAAELVSNEIINFIHGKKIGLEFMITESACKTFNLLISEGRKVVAGLIV